MEIPFKADCIGPLESRADLNEWDYDMFKFPPPVKGKKLNQWKFGMR